MTHSSENTVSQIENLKADLYYTKVKMKMLNIRIGFHKDY